jgi:hypothetical protein
VRREGIVTTKTSDKFLLTVVIEYDEREGMPDIMANMKCLNGTVIRAMWGDAIAELTGENENDI